MPNTCAAITDIGSYSEIQSKTVGGSVLHIFEENNIMATRIDVVILSITGDVGVEDVVLTSSNYSDETANQYIYTKWGKGLFTIASASPSGYFQRADMHFMMPSSGSLGTCTIQFVIKVTSPSSVLEKRLFECQKNVYFEHVVFHPYYENIVDCYVERTSLSYFNIRVVDKGGITSETTINNQNNLPSHDTSFGVLHENQKNGLFYIPAGETVRVKVQSRLDTAATSMGYYPMCTIQTDRWYPTYNGLFKLFKTSDSTSIEMVDNKDGFETDGKDIVFFYFFLKNLFPVSKNESDMDTSFIQGRFQNAINAGHRRIGLVFCPTTEGSTLNSNVDNVNGIPVYYHFPSWMLAELKQNAVYKPYIIDRIDTYTSATIKMYNLDWRDNYTRTLYKDCVLKVANYMKNTSSQLYGKPLYNYIDVLEVAFAGTWGEGTTLNTLKANYPTASELLDVSDYICNTLFPDKLCLRSLASTLNADFPESYRQAILNPSNPKRIGVFFNGVGQEPFDYFFTSINNYTASSPKLMNEVYNYVKDHPSYVECALSDNGNNIPDYASIGTFAKFFRPCYLNLHNISIDNLLSAINLQRVIKLTSHYVGYRPYIFINRCKLNNHNVVKIDLSIGNFGTARFYQSYWKLRFFAQTYSAGGDFEREELLVSSFDLSTIPAPFEAGVPNYHDTVLWTENLTLTNSVASGKHFCLLVTIEDSEGIYDDPIWFCNDEESLPREQIGQTPTGRFFLIYDYSVA